MLEFVGKTCSRKKQLHGGHTIRGNEASSDGSALCHCSGDHWPWRSRGQGNTDAFPAAFCRHVVGLERGLAGSEIPGTRQPGGGRHDQAATLLVFGRRPSWTSSSSTRCESCHRLAAAIRQDSRTDPHRCPKWPLMKEIGSVFDAAWDVEQERGGPPLDLRFNLRLP